MKRLDDEILYLRLDNFMDEGAIGRVYQECLPMMTEVKFLLIDVRQNGWEAAHEKRRNWFVPSQW